MSDLRSALALLIKDHDRGMESSEETWDYARNALAASEPCRQYIDGYHRAGYPDGSCKCGFKVL